jgi:NAD(P)H-dependent flavin oxidoreductase YrpB (nitropropane dioxygenase family)
MVIETNITKMLGIKHPILSAPMGPFYTTKLTVAVSEAGGLGVLSHVTIHGTVTLDEMKKSMEYVVEHTDKPFGFNIRTARLQPDAIKLCRQLPRFIMEIYYGESKNKRTMRLFNYKCGFSKIDI